MSERLSEDILGDIPSGTYAAGDSVKFSLNPFGDKFLFQIADDPEVYVLSEGRASLGGHVLKYDSGATALMVSGFGGMTLYTDAEPNGLPAVRDDNSVVPSLAQATLADVEHAAQDEMQHLAYSHQLNLSFAADWNALAADANGRALAFDALQNTARGLDRFAAYPAARSLLVQKIDSVRLEAGRKPGTTLKGRVLVVSFNTGRSFAGRPSSRAIARDLAKLLDSPQASR